MAGPTWYNGGNAEPSRRTTRRTHTTAFCSFYPAACRTHRTPAAVSVTASFGDGGSWSPVRYDMMPEPNVEASARGTLHPQTGLAAAFFVNQTSPNVSSGRSGVRLRLASPSRIDASNSFTRSTCCGPSPAGGTARDPSPTVSSLSSAIEPDRRHLIGAGEPAKPFTDPPRPVAATCLRPWDSVPLTWDDSPSRGQLVAGRRRPSTPGSRAQRRDSSARSTGGDRAARSRSCECDSAAGRGSACVQSQETSVTVIGRDWPGGLE